MCSIVVLLSDDDDYVCDLCDRNDSLWSIKVLLSFIIRTLQIGLYHGVPHLSPCPGCHQQQDLQQPCPHMSCVTGSHLDINYITYLLTHLTCMYIV